MDTLFWIVVSLGVIISIGCIMHAFLNRKRQNKSSSFSDPFDFDFPDFD